MPDKPQKPCNRCKKNLTRGKYCSTCQPIIDANKKVQGQIYDTRRGKTAARGYDAQWNKIRIQAKAEGMWVCQCDRCKAMGRIKAVTKSDPVHHIKPVDKYPGLRLELSNLVSMTRVCHECEENRKIDRDWEDWQRKTA